MLLAGPVVRSSVLDSALPVARFPFAVSNRNHLVCSSLLAIYHGERKPLHEISSRPFKVGHTAFRVFPNSCDDAIKLFHKRFSRRGAPDLIPFAGSPCFRNCFVVERDFQRGHLSAKNHPAGFGPRDRLRLARIEFANTPTDFVSPGSFSILIDRLVKTLDE